jgi:hypothetical protein
VHVCAGDFARISPDWYEFFHFSLSISLSWIIVSSYLSLESSPGLFFLVVASSTTFFPKKWDPEPKLVGRIQLSPALAALAVTSPVPGIKFVVMSGIGTSVGGTRYCRMQATADATVGHLKNALGGEDVWLKKYPTAKPADQAATLVLTTQPDQRLHDLAPFGPILEVNFFNRLLWWEVQEFYVHFKFEEVERASVLAAFDEGKEPRP